MLHHFQKEEEDHVINHILLIYLPHINLQMYLKLKQIKNLLKFMFYKY